jgi:hypothetical protein
MPGYHQVDRTGIAGSFDYLFDCWVRLAYSRSSWQGSALDGAFDNRLRVGPVKHHLQYFGYECTILLQNEEQMLRSAMLGLDKHTYM